jgi:hypothetical protein
MEGPAAPQPPCAAAALLGRRTAALAPAAASPTALADAAAVGAIAIPCTDFAAVPATTAIVARQPGNFAGALELVPGAWMVATAGAVTILLHVPDDDTALISAAGAAAPSPRRPAPPGDGGGSGGAAGLPTEAQAVALARLLAAAEKATLRALRGEDWDIAPARHADTTEQADKLLMDCALIVVWLQVGARASGGRPAGRRQVWPMRTRRRCRGRFHTGRYQKLPSSCSVYMLCLPLMQPACALSCVLKMSRCTRTPRVPHAFLPSGPPVTTGRGLVPRAAGRPQRAAAVCFDGFRAHGGAPACGGGRRAGAGRRGARQFCQACVSHLQV